MPYSRIAAVTGGNRGIGFAIVRNLALQYPSSSFNNGPLLIYLTARDKIRGENAVKDLKADDQLQRAKALTQDGGLTSVEYHSLDISDESSIHDFKTFLEKEHPDGIDILINNAGVAIDGFDATVVERTLQCNYHGTHLMTTTLLPHIRPHGRVVNIASMLGKLNKYSPGLTARFQSATRTSQITALMAEFHTAVANGTWTQDGWPSTAYGVSKAGVIGMTGCVGAEERARGRGVLVNSCCPGFVKTGMTKGRGAKTPDEGAKTPVMLALGELGAVTGGFWRGDAVDDW